MGRRLPQKMPTTCAADISSRARGRASESKDASVLALCAAVSAVAWLAVIGRSQVVWSVCMCVMQPTS